MKVQGSSKSLLALLLTASLASGTVPLGAQQAQAPLTAPSGVIAGRATDQARQPYSDYTVQLRDAATGVAVGSTPLGPTGTFSFPAVDFGRKYLVELYSNRQSRLICTEGPFALSASIPQKTNVNIACGKAPTSLALLAAAAGTAVAIALATRSVSQ